MVSTSILAAVLFTSSAAAAPSAAPGPPPVDPAVAAMKPFAWKCRVTGVLNGTALPPTAVVTWQFGSLPAPTGPNALSSVGTAWTPAGTFDAKWAQSFAAGYPDMYMVQEHLPFITAQLIVSAAVNQTIPPLCSGVYGTGKLSCEQAFAAASNKSAASCTFNKTGCTFAAGVTKTVPLPVGVNGSLWEVEVEVSSAQWVNQTTPLTLSSTLAGGTGPASLGIMLSLDTTQVAPPVQTYLSFVTSRYGPAFAEAVGRCKNATTGMTPPRKFGITDRLVGGGDSDPRTRAFLINGLLELGLSGLEGLSKAEMTEYGMVYTGGGVYT